MAGACGSRRDGRIPYLPALDGFRGLAVLAVVLFHGDIAGSRGGFLGVTAFFVLSGFLIGSLLLVEREQSGRIDLVAFWVRRARRLVPGALVLVAVVIAYVAWGTDRAAPGVVGDGFASATWVANWRFVFAGRSYGALFSDPSPFQHMWSLAVEEQFYLVLPLAAVLLRHRRRIAVAVSVGIAASAVLAVALPSTRAYYGTDTRAAEPLIGVLLAVALITGRPRRRLLLELAGGAGLAGLVAMVLTVPETSHLLSRGGFLLAATLAAGVVASATEPRTLVARALATPPLVALGRISYGVYLYHWPVFLVFNEARTGLNGARLFGVRCATTLALATLSYFLVERPIRWGRFRVKVGVVGWANATVGLLAGLVLASSVTSSASTSLLASSSSEAAPPLPTTVATTPTPTTPPASVAVVPSARPPRKGGRPAPVSAPTPRPSEAGTNLFAATPPPRTAPPPEPPSTPQGPPALRVAVVGDSLADNVAEGLVAWAGARSDVVVYNLSTPGCPLSRGGRRTFPDGTEWAIEPVCGWWDDPKSDRSAKLAQFDPDLVVAQDSFNEVLDRKTPEWPYYRHPGDLTFDEWLFDEYSALAGTFVDRGAKVLALNSVCVDWKTLGSRWRNFSYGEGDTRLGALDRVTARLADNGELTADLGQQVCPDGKFTQTVAGVDHARPDGYHLSPEAAAALAQRWLGPLVLQLAKPS